SAEPAHRGRRFTSVPRLERPAHLPDRALQATARALRLPRQAVHRFRPARPPRLPERRRGDLRRTHARALRAPFHRAVGFFAVPAGAGYVLPVIAVEYRERVSALGPDPVRAFVE